MYHLIDARVIEPQIRQRICSRCWRRPAHSEDLSPATPRACQPTCAIFRKLPTLVTWAEVIDPMIASREAVIRHRIADYCDGATSDVETLRYYGPGLAHIIADMVETGG